MQFYVKYWSIWRCGTLGVPGNKVCGNIGVVIFNVQSRDWDWVRSQKNQGHLWPSQRARLCIWVWCSEPAFFLLKLQLLHVAVSIPWVYNTLNRSVFITYFFLSIQFQNLLTESLWWVVFYFLKESPNVQPRPAGTLHFPVAVFWELRSQAYATRSESPITSLTAGVWMMRGCPKWICL